MIARRRTAALAVVVLLTLTANLGLFLKRGVYTISPPKVVSAQQRILSFSGYYWTVRDTAGYYEQPAYGPYSSSDQNVWIDAEGSLHLRITSKKGTRISTQVTSTSPFGYGTYRFRVHLDAAGLDRWSVFGLYTFGPKSAEGAPNELDIEHGDVGVKHVGTTSQFVVQPYSVVGHLHRFDVPSAALDRIEEIKWFPNGVQFTVYDATEPLAPPIARWSYSSAKQVPQFEGDALNMTMWSLPRHSGPATPIVNEAIIDWMTYKPLLLKGK